MSRPTQANPWRRIRTPRGTRPPKTEVPKTQYRRHPKHQDREPAEGPCLRRPSALD